MRYGEMTAFEERPHSPYYGCADATPLYVVLLDEYERWTGDRKLVRELEHEARAALALDRRVRRPAGQRLHLVPAPQREDRPREPVLEGLVGLDLLPRRPAARLPARDLRAAGLRLRREDARRPAGPRGLEGPGVRRRARAAGGRPQAPLQPRLLGRRRRVLRARARHRRQAGRRADLEHRPPALERHRRQVEGEGGRAPPARAAALLRLGRAHARRGRGRATTRSATTSAPSGRSTTRSSPGACAATASRRRPRRSPPGSSTPPSSSTAGCRRRSAATSATLTKYPVQYPTACSPQAWSTGAPLLLLRTMLGLEPIGDHLVVDPALPDEHRPARAARHPRPLGPHRRVRTRPGRDPRLGGFDRGTAPAARHDE